MTLPNKRKVKITEVAVSLKKKEGVVWGGVVGGGEGVVGRNCYIWTIWVCDVVKGMTFKPFHLG